MTTLQDEAVAPRARAFHPLTVAAVEALTDDSVAVTFDVPEELRGRFDFAAGQSLTLRRMIEGREHRRTYSICAPVGHRPRVGAVIVFKQSGQLRLGHVAVVSRVVDVRAASCAISR